MGSGRGQNKRVNSRELSSKQINAINRYKEATDHGWPTQEIKELNDLLKINNKDKLVLPSGNLPSALWENQISMAHATIDKYYLGLSGDNHSKEEIEYCLSELMKDMIRSISTVNAMPNDNDNQMSMDIKYLIKQIDVDKIKISYDIKNAGDFRYEVYLQFLYNGQELESYQHPAISFSDTVERGTVNREEVLRKHALEFGLLHNTIVINAVWDKLLLKAINKTVYTSYYVLNDIEV